jgi:hypothetical protein
MPISIIIYYIYCDGIILLSAIMGCRMLRRNWQFRYRLLVILCCATFIIEMVSVVCSILDWTKGYVYNSWLPLESFTVTYILLGRAIHTWASRLGHILLALFSAGVVLSYALHPVFSKINVFADQSGVFMQLIASCACLIDMLQDKEMLERPLTARPLFWVAVGMLGSCSFFAVILSLEQLFVRTKFSLDIYMPFSYIANTCMYGGFIAAFITLKKQRLYGATDHRLPALPLIRRGD